MFVSVLNLFIDIMGAVVSGNDAHTAPDNDMHDSMGKIGQAGRVQLVAGIRV